MLKGKSCFLLIFFLSLALGLLWTASQGFAKIYFSEDFESYKEGDEIVDVSDVWIIGESRLNPPGGVASKKQAHGGRMSAIFDRQSVMGVTLDELDLPDNYVAAVWFYHDSKQNPQPDCVIIMGEGKPASNPWPLGTGKWLGIGTRSLALNQKNYTYRDKTGTGKYEGGVM